MQLSPIRSKFICNPIQIPKIADSLNKTMGSPKNPKPNHAQNEAREEFLHPLSDKLQTLTLTGDGDGESNSDGEVSTSNSYSHYRSADQLIFPPPSAVTDPLLFPPFHDRLPETNGNGDVSVSPPKSQPSTSDYLRISVSDPQKESEPSNSIVPGGNTYTSYLITTSTNLSDYEESNFTVRRRFRDVVAMSDRLSEGYRGLFVPPRPDKSLVESQVMQKQEFVEQRRVEVEKYLRRLARHPVIRRSDELRVFLTVEGRMSLLDGESSSVVVAGDVVNSAKGGRDVLRFFKELKQSVVNDWGNGRASVEEEDKEFLEKKVKLKDLEQHLSNASQQVVVVLQHCDCDNC